MKRLAIFWHNTPLMIASGSSGLTGSMKNIPKVDQLNNIHPAVVADHLQKAFDWLATGKKLRMAEVEWSIHKDTKILDRPEKFWYLTYTCMWDAISFEMHCNNLILPLGSLWYCHGCIPIAMSFFRPSGGPTQPVGRIQQHARVLSAGYVTHSRIQLSVLGVTTPDYQPMPNSG